MTIGILQKEYFIKIFAERKFRCSPFSSFLFTELDFNYVSSLRTCFVDSAITEKYIAAVKDSFLIEGEFLFGYGQSTQ